MSDTDRFEIGGSATPQEREVILQLLKQMLREERELLRPSAWKTAGRAAASRSGILDNRDRVGASRWIMGGRLPWTGRPYNGRHGRGDAK